MLIEPPRTPLKPYRIPPQKPPRHRIVHAGAVVVEVQVLVPFASSVGVAVVLGGGRNRGPVSVEEGRLAVGGVTIPLGDRANTVRQCGDAVLLVAIRAKDGVLDGDA